MAITARQGGGEMRLGGMGTASPVRVEEPLKKPTGSASSAIRRQTGCMRILVVEDDELTASALQRGLAAEGYAVEAGQRRHRRAAPKAREFSYDAMILRPDAARDQRYRPCWLGAAGRRARAAGADADGARRPG